MSRSCYSDDYGDEFPGQLELYRANVQRSIRSKAGQARLRELRDALLALPVKELEADTFAGGSPETPRVCALGAWALAKAGDVEAAGDMVPTDADDHDTYDALKAHGWPKLVVLEAIYQNDDGHVYRHETPALRYARVLAWVERELLPTLDAVDPQAGSTGRPTTREGKDANSFQEP
jgi:hypothetical protein